MIAWLLMILANLKEIIADLTAFIIKEMAGG